MLLKYYLTLVHARKTVSSGTFKAMYQQIQGLHIEEKGLEISKVRR